MSFRSVGSIATANNSGLSTKDLHRVIAQPDPPVWVRNPSWPVCDANLGDKKVVGLYAVFSAGSNFIALRAQNNYTVDWGDGTVTNYTSGTDANYEYDYNDPQLVGTEAPAALTASTNTVDRTAHGYTNGMSVTLYSVTGTSAVVSGRPYFVVNATANTFQVSLTSGGSPIAFGTNGTANLLPYRVATVSITAQVANTLALVNLDIKHSQSGLNTYAQGWLDFVVAAENLTSLTVGRIASTTQSAPLEQVRIKQWAVTNASNMFTQLRQLRRVEITADTSSLTITNSMFSACTSLTEVPLFNTSAVTNFSSMFSGCRNLRSVPAFNTSAGTTFQLMFSSCSTLLKVPPLDGRNVLNFSSMFLQCACLETAPPIQFGSVGTNTTSMFSGCRSLRNVPLYDLQFITTATSMFQDCVSLVSVPPFNLQRLQTATSMFQGCFSLVDVPFLNTPALLNTSSMFQNCSAMVEAPLFDTSKVTLASSMFNGCGALLRVPAYNFAAVTNLTSMFSGCTSLTAAPKLSFPLATNASSMFSACASLVDVPNYSIPNLNNTSSMFTNCTSLITAPVLPTSAVTNMQSMFQNCSNLQYVPLYDTGLVTNTQNMFASCSSLLEVPNFNIVNVSNVNSMFSSCFVLSEIPAFNLNAVSSSFNMTSFASSCNSLARFRATGPRFNLVVSGCKMSKTALEELFSNLGSAASPQTINVATNYGIGAQPARTSTTTSGSTTITLTDTSTITTGMLVTGNNLAVTTATTGTADVAADTVTRTAHGLANGTKVAFTSLGAVTNVSLHRVYFVVNATTDTFQVAATVGGATIDLTGTGGSVSFKYPAYVVSIVPNTSVTISAPAIASGSATVTYRALDQADALLKNWSVAT